MRTKSMSLFLFLLVLLTLTRDSSLPSAQAALAEGLTVASDQIVYPFARRFRISSLFDHHGANNAIDGVITIYTGAMVSDDPNDPNDQVVNGNIRGYTDYDLTVRDLRWSNFTPGWLWYDGHQAYDITSPNGTDVAAAGAGTVRFTNEFPPNGMYVDHGNGYSTYYGHLSQRSVAEWTTAYPGTQIGQSGVGGTGAHLHFEMRYNTTRIDPYQGNRWISGDPIPMGYRDQAGVVHGPYALDNTTIRNKWLALDGKPGSPLGLVYQSTCPTAGAAPLAISYIQGFERGYIQYCAGSNAEYIEYTKTYLPGVRAHEDADEWNSTIIIRNNNGSGSATVNITFYDQAGRILDSRTQLSVPKRGLWIVNARDVLLDFLTQAGYDGMFTGSAVVAASEDVSVVVENSNGVRYNNYNGLRAGGLDSGWGQTGTNIYVPLAKFHYNGKNSRFYILNIGSAATNNIPIKRYDGNGTSTTLNIGTLAPYAMADVEFVANTAGRYSAWIESTQPLAVVVAEESQNDASIIYKLQNVFAAGATPVFVPQVRNTASDFTTLAVQNLGDEPTNVTVSYYREQGPASPYCYETKNGVAVNASAVFQVGAVCSSDTFTVGSALVSENRGQPLAVLVNEAGEKGYSGFLAGSQTVVLPRVRRDASWWTGIRVMNVDGGTPTSGTIDFYESDGDSFRTRTFAIATGGYHTVNLGTHLVAGDNFNGSAVIVANRPIVVSVILTMSGYPQRTMMYNGNNR